MELAVQMRGAWADTRTAATWAEARGLAAFAMPDHYLRRASAPDDDAFDHLTHLAALAATTEHIELVSLVSPVTFRHPAVLLKMAVTIDDISGGRFTLGVGTGWLDAEFELFGIPYPDTAIRYEMLEECLAYLRAALAPGPTPYEGRHYQLAETLCVPAPLSSPRPPILIGGSGERKTLRLVAQYADACNLFAGTPDDVVRLLDVLRRHGDDVGRDTSEIRVTTLYGGGALGQDLDAFVDEMAAFGKVGVDTVYVMPPGDRPAAWIEEVAGPAAARMADLPVG